MEEQLENIIHLVAATEADRQKTAQVRSLAGDEKVLAMGVLMVKAFDSDLSMCLVCAEFALVCLACHVLACASYMDGW